MVVGDNEKDLWRALIAAASTDQKSLLRSPSSPSIGGPTPSEYIPPAPYPLAYILQCLEDDLRRVTSANYATASAQLRPQWRQRGRRLRPSSMKVPPYLPPQLGSYTSGLLFGR